MQGPKFGVSNPFSADYWKYQVSGQAVRDGLDFVTGGDVEMGISLATEAFALGKSLFKRKAKKVASRVAQNVATNLASNAISSGIGTAIQRYTSSGPSFPAIPPATFGWPGTPPGQGGGANIGNTLGNILGGFANGYTQGGGTYVQKHPNAHPLPDGTIWSNGHLYVLRQNGRLQRVTRDKFGNIVPAPKHMNVLNPHALRRSMRRVQGFHAVATKAVKEMEKWARKSTSHHRGRAALPRGKKK